MKKHIYYFFISLLGMIVVSCGEDDISKREPTDTRSPRAVLVYMVAQNNLSPYALSDREEMIVAARKGDLGDSRLIAYYDPKGANPELQELVIDGDGNASFKTLAVYDDETLSVSAARMSQVIADFKALVPARKYGMILWGHGTGYVQDGLDETYAPEASTMSISPLSYGCETVSGKSNWMNVTTMAQVLKDQHFDWLYFDCCFMAGVEVAYELRDVTNYIVASATETPGDGMPYDKTLKYLMPEGLQLEKAATATFDHYDKMSGIDRTCTMSVIRTAGMTNLAQVAKYIYAQAGQLPASYEPQSYQTPYAHQHYGWSYYDFGHYLKALASTCNIDNLNVDMALSQVVTVSYATPLLWNEVALTNHSGLSTLIIERVAANKLDTTGYRELQWWQDVVAPRFN